MKRFGVIALAAIVAVAVAVPAWSLEMEFGGYWRTRAFMNESFTGEDETEAADFNWVDTRTRLYFTAIFHENLKFVNKFEFNSTWGGDDLGRIGADATDRLRIKNSYADFNLGPVGFKIGIQGVAVARGFVFDDDVAGAVVSFGGDTVSVPVLWLKGWEGKKGKNAGDNDFDIVGISPEFSMGGVTINPFGLYMFSDNPDDLLGPEFDETKLYYVGLNFDADYDMASLWLTGVYQGGDIDMASGETVEFSAWLAAAGLSANIGIGDIHGEAFYATGNDPEDEDMNQFWVPAGQSYYWAEIMGYGIFDEQCSNNSPEDQIGNIMAANLGITLKPTKKLAVSVDAWYAALAEDIKIGDSEENYLGTEVDLKISYKLLQGLTLDIVGAYLFAGEVTTEDDPNEADPYEIGTRLSLKF